MRRSHLQICVSCTKIGQQLGTAAGQQLDMRLMWEPSKWVLLMRPALTRFWPPCHKPDSIGSGSNMLFSVKQRGGPEQWAKHMHTCWNSEYCHCLPFHRLLHRMASDEIHQCIDHWLCRPRGRECPLHVSDQEATEPAKHARYAAKASSI